ncbi:MAG: putative maturation protein [Firnpuvirus faecenecus]|uniref:Maturation protein n=1 Tax=Leviviridae sp. TaxID=2027243 RepID=A0ABY3SS16_9VIRU|nr:MAG: putative maturation protein [Leviviridae sp.]
MTIKGVPRFTNAYGSHERTTTTTHVNVNSLGWETNWSATFKERCYRSTPQNGVMVGNFRKPTPWRLYASKITPGTFDYYYGSGKTRTYGTFPDTGDGMPWPSIQNPATGIVSNPVWMRASAEVAALNAIKDQNIDIGVALGEANRTLGFIAESVTTLAKAVHAGLRGDWVRAGKVLGHSGWANAADGWLRYQYAFKPLLSDIYGAAEELSKPLRTNGWLFSATGTASDDLPPWRATTAVVPGPNTSFSGFYTRFTRVKLWLRIDDIRLYNLSSVGLINPLAIAWELVTLSFVIDWFIPIGALIEALTSSVGTSFVAGLRDDIQSYDINVEHARLGYKSGKKCSYRAQSYAFQRDVYAFLPFPSPFVLLSGSGLSNLPRAVSAAALLSQRR